MDMTAGRDRSFRMKIMGLIGFYLAYFLSYFIKLSPSIIMPVL